MCWDNTVSGISALCHILQNRTVQQRKKIAQLWKALAYASHQWIAERTVGLRLQYCGIILNRIVPASVEGYMPLELWTGEYETLSHFAFWEQNVMCTSQTENTYVGPKENVGSTVRIYE